jgi:hypothetical protein
MGVRGVKIDQKLRDVIDGRPLKLLVQLHDLQSVHLLDMGPPLGLHMVRQAKVM